jgi:hypothetical protein
VRVSQKEGKRSKLSFTDLKNPTEKNIYKGGEIGYDEEENKAKLNGWHFVKAAVGQGQCLRVKPKKDLK